VAELAITLDDVPAFELLVELEPEVKIVHGLQVRAELGLEMGRA